MPMTLEQAEAAIADLRKAVEPETLTKTINDAINKAAKPLVTRLVDGMREEFVRSAVEEIGSNPEVRKLLGGDDKGGGGDQKPNPEVEKLRKDFEAVKAKELRARAKEAIVAGLKKHGIDSDLPVRLFIADATEADDGFRIGERPLDEAIAEFAKSDDGKRFIPAKPGSGTGSRPGAGGAGGAPAKPEPIDWVGLGTATAQHR